MGGPEISNHNLQIGSSAKPSIPADISSDAQNFLAKTFELDYEARPSAQELLLHPWLAAKKSKGHNTKMATTPVSVEVAA